MSYGSSDRTTILSRSSPPSARHAYNNPAIRDGATDTDHITPVISDHHLPVERSISSSEQPITVSWIGVNAFVEPQGRRCCWESGNVPRQILRDVNGVVKPGTLLAILGASGAGKSTLLNVVNQRNTRGLIVEGDIFLNGSKVNSNILTAKSAYVQQDDLFITLLKVKEHLWFQSMLRMDHKVSNEMREQRVAEVMRELGLTKCADTMIGNPGVKKSISGGERKRLAFASEVLTNPSLMFCDEPTSGLDSFMAENVVVTLKNLAARGKTILCTIHQPSSEVYALFDNVLIMADGRAAFMGPANEAVPFFNECGYQCPPAHNPADFFIHTLAIVPGKEDICKQRITTICDSYEKTPIFDEMMKMEKDLNLNSIETQIASSSRYKTSWCRQFRVVLWRSWVTSLREPNATRLKFGQALFTAMVFGLIFLQQEYNQKGVMNINGALFLMQTQVSFGNIFSVITTFPLEFPIFYREHKNGMYRCDVYYLSKIMAEFPLYIIIPLVFSSITYWMIGLYPDANSFLICAGSLILVTNVATSYGYVVGCSTSSVNLATALLPSVIIPLMLFGGFFLNSGSVPVYFIWLQYLSWFNFCNEILIVNQWKDVKNITCEYLPPSFNTTLMGPSASSRCFTNGEQVIESLSFHEDNVLVDVYALLALMVGFRIVSYIILLIRSSRKN